MALYQRLWLDEFDRLYEGFTKSTLNSSQVIRQLPVYGLADITIPDTINSALWTGVANAPILSYPLNQANVVRVTTCLRDATIQAAGTPLVEDDTWTELSPATSPAARRYMGSCYYPPGGYILMFGGVIGPAGSNCTDQTWKYDGTTWTNLSPAHAPTARLIPCMAYDAANSKVVLFGGDNGSGTFHNDTWTWDGSDWTQESPGTVPSARGGACAVYDENIGAVLMFGGRGAGYTYPTQTYKWTGTNWVSLGPATTPPGRYLFGMAYDEVNNKVVMHGGQTHSGFITQKTHTWDGTDWTDTGGTNPGYNFTATNFLTWDVISQTVIAVGRAPEGSSTKCEVYDWDGSDWGSARTLTTKPYSRVGYLVVGMPTAVILFGGDSSYVAGIADDDTWEIGSSGGGALPTDGETGLWLGTSNQNLYWIAWRPGDGKCVTNRIIGGTATAGDTTAGTLTAPLYLRLTLNRGAGTVVAEYSDAGSSWTTLTTWSSISIVPSTFGLFARNLDPYPAVWGAYDWVGVELLPHALQYRPIPTRETSSNDALAVRGVRDLARAIDNAKAFALNHKRWSYCWPAGAKLSTAAGTGEKVILCFAPRYLPEGYNLLRVTVGHERFAGTGTTTWRLYATKYIYRGATTIQSSFLCADYDAEDIATTSSDTHAISYTETLKAVREGNTGDCYLLLTANNSDGTTRSRLTTLDVTHIIDNAKKLLHHQGLL